MAQYFRSVRRADQVVGAVLDAIENEGQSERTLVIFKSDHGMPLPFAKTNCWRHSTRTPWIVRWPGVIQPGMHDTQHVVSGVDLAPTILDAIGLPNLEGADGRSVLPILKGEQQSNREYVITHINRTAGKRQFPMRSVIGKRFGYIYNAWANGETVFKNESQAGLTMKAMRVAARSDPQLQTRVDHFLYRTSEEFYDYQSDPDALTNLIGEPKHAERIKAMRAELLEQMRETDDPVRVGFETMTGTWSVRSANIETTVSFRGLDVIDANTVWAAGQKGTMLRTVDGGKSWNVGKIAGPELLDYRGIAGLTPTTALAVSAGSPARIVKSTDGGESWQVKFETEDVRVFFDAIAFWNNSDGITFSDPIDGKLLIMTTNDAGETWAAVDTADLPPALDGEAGFAASNSCLCVHGNNRAWIGLGGKTSQPGARVFYTVDRGKTWDVSPTPIASR